jgi:uncharacterized FlaG/YvyC family protein
MLDPERAGFMRVEAMTGMVAVVYREAGTPTSIFEMPPEDALWLAARLREAAHAAMSVTQ